MTPNAMAPNRITAIMPAGSFTEEVVPLVVACRVHGAEHGSELCIAAWCVWLPHRSAAAGACSACSGLFRGRNAKRNGANPLRQLGRPLFCSVVPPKDRNTDTYAHARAHASARAHVGLSSGRRNRRNSGTKPVFARVLVFRFAFRRPA